ncbi:hypothetical protein [Arcanobacterium phocae]|uniref:hypothetical protein n=1 Tax=Arcanobacterium phocae TaxID=131112 RepID=UPI001C0F130E|nr:hypothetical protein [Arcanobacterium phocae]
MAIPPIEIDISMAEVMSAVVRPRVSPIWPKTIAPNGRIIKLAYGKHREASFSL